MKKLLIIGAGGHGKVCAEIAENMGKWDKISFLDDKLTEKVLQYSIIDKVVISKYVNSNTDFFVAVGDNTIRKKIYDNICEENGNIAVLIDKNAYISKHIEVDYGSVIMPGSLINAGAYIGKGVIINTGVIIEHDCIVGDFSHLSPGVSLGGNVSIGQLTWIGMNATVINNIKITNNTIIGAGALVIKNLKESGTYVGSPVRKVST